MTATTGRQTKGPIHANGDVSVEERDWVDAAVQAIEADFTRSADTHLVKLDLPRLAAAGIDLYLKDELTHPSGSLKHRLARSLFLYGLATAGSGRDDPSSSARPARRRSRRPISRG